MIEVVGANVDITDPENLLQAGDSENIRAFIKAFYPSYEAIKQAK